MIESRTVFVLGAGASRPYGFPTGLELREYICSPKFLERMQILMDNCSNLERDEIDDWLQNINQFRDAFKNSGNASIDLFLSRNRQWADEGKLAISIAILDSEVHSKFSRPTDISEKDWMSELWDRMTDNLKGPRDHMQFASNDVSFITFNYDRSLEQFFFERLKHSYTKATAEEIRYVMGAITIHHVYGLIEKPIEVGGLLTYGVKPVALDQLLERKNNISLIDERIVVDNVCSRLLRLAERIFFLGFGYAKENLTVLGIPDCLSHSPEIYGTAKGLVDGQVKRIKEDLLTGRTDKSLALIEKDFDSKMVLRQYL